MNIKELFLPDTSVRNPTGVFTLTGTEMGYYAYQPVRLLHLADWSGTTTVRDQWNVSRWLRGIKLPIPVHAELQRWDPPEGRSYSLINLRQPAPWEIQHGLELIPDTDIPTLAFLAFKELVRFTAELRNPYLKRLVSDVLSDPAISRPFFHLPASGKYHHSYEGGLLVHSVDMLQPIAGFLAGPRHRHLDREVTQVGYMFHDLGKVRSYAPNADPSIPHEQHTLQMLRPHLDTLAAHEPGTALLLNGIFDRCATSPRKRKRSDFIGAQMVTFADGISTQKDREAANDCWFEEERPEIGHG